MTRKTKHIFNGPWKAEEYEHGRGAWVVRNSKGYLIAENLSGQDAKIFTHLPDLYDALADAVREACCDCIAQVYDNPETYDPVEQGCLFKNEHCCDKCRSWIKLLQTVKSGV